MYTDDTIHKFNKNNRAEMDRNESKANTVSLRFPSLHIVEKGENDG